MNLTGGFFFLKLFKYNDWVFLEYGYMASAYLGETNLPNLILSFSFFKLPMKSETYADHRLQHHTLKKKKCIYVLVLKNRRKHLFVTSVFEAAT